MICCNCKKETPYSKYCTCQHCGHCPKCGTLSYHPIHLCSSEENQKEAQPQKKVDDK